MKRSGKLGEQAVFEYLLVRGEVSVPQIVKRLRVPATTALGILTRLQERGLTVRGEDRAGKRGRPVATYHIRLRGPTAAFFIDGSQLLGGIVDEEQNVLAMRSAGMSGTSTLDQTTKLVSRLLDALAQESGVKRKDLEGVGLSLNATHVGDKTLTSSVLSWVDSDILRAFEERFELMTGMVDRPVMLSEFRKLPDPTPAKLIYFQVADGVSSHQLTLGQELWGANAMEGEVGHITVDPDGMLCGCGRRGCLETYCSGPAICRQIANDLSTSAVTSLDRPLFEGDSPREAIANLWEAWQAGDSYARAVVDQVLDRLAWAMGIVINLADPNLMIMGGYVLADKQAWVDELKTKSQRWIVHAARRENPIVLGETNDQDILRTIASQFSYKQRSDRSVAVAAAT